MGPVIRPRAPISRSAKIFDPKFKGGSGFDSGDVAALVGQNAWQDHRNKHHAKANWQFKTADARVKLKRPYPQFEVTRATRGPSGGGHSEAPSRRRQRTLVSNFVQTPVGQRAHSSRTKRPLKVTLRRNPSGRMEGSHA